MEEEEPLVALAPVAPSANRCTGFSSPGAGPVDRIKSAKSRIESPFTCGSLANGFLIDLLLLDVEGMGPLLCGAVLTGRCCDPNWLSLSALTRGYTVTEDLGFVEGLGASRLTTARSCSY
jgi:hypothetical protein